MTSMNGWIIILGEVKKQRNKDTEDGIDSYNKNKAKNGAKTKPQCLLDQSR